MALLQQPDIVYAQIVKCGLKVYADLLPAASAIVKYELMTFPVENSLQTVMTLVSHVLFM